MAEVLFSKNIESILDKLDFSKLGKKVAVKVHFGERGCTTYLDPKLVKKVYDKIISLGKEATLVECNVLYKGSRTNSAEHIKTAEEHGFDGMNIDILDGEDGSEFIEINGCKIGKGLKKYDSLVVISHFKGHSMTGFGGAIKNLGMGLGSRAGKLDMHSAIKPFISEKCTGCGVCIKHCNAGAITFVNGKAVIDKAKCEGCAMCVAVCNSDAVVTPWDGRPSEGLQKRTAEYACSALSLFSNPIFINVLENITEECDCFDYAQKPIMQDVGILAATDIVAIDKASLDLANKFSASKFNQINKTNKDKQIEVAEELSLGSSKYQLIEL